MPGRILFFLFLLLPSIAPAQVHNLRLEAEIKKIDTLAANPEAKPVVVAAMADQLGVHRNHLMLLRRKTGQTYGQIFVSSLKSAGETDSRILQQAEALNQEIERRWRQSTQPEASVRPVLYLGTTVDHNSAGTYYSLTPEVGIQSRHLSLVLGVPYYYDSGTQFSANGVGDVYATGSLHGRAAGVDLLSSLTIGFPTGDESVGLGAGQTSFDISGTLGRRFAKFRPFVTAGFTNSIFNNVGYQRPYITSGNAAHVSGGMEVQALRRLTVGAGGFAVRPSGTQTVYSRSAMGQMSGGNIGSGTPTGATSPGPMNPGMSGGMGGTAQTPVYARGGQESVPASELEDYGANVWASLNLTRAVSLNFAVARSIPFELTTVQVGLGFNFARLLFPGRHF